MAPTVATKCVNRHSPDASFRRPILLRIGASGKPLRPGPAGGATHDRHAEAFERLSWRILSALARSWTPLAGRVGVNRYPRCSTKRRAIRDALANRGLVQRMNALATELLGS